MEAPNPGPAAGGGGTAVVAEDVPGVLESEAPKLENPGEIPCDTKPGDTPAPAGAVPPKFREASPSVPKLGLAFEVAP